MPELPEPFVRPVRVPEQIALCTAEPPLARAGETGRWKLSFELSENVAEGEELYVLFHGGRNVKGAFRPLQVTDPDAPGFVSARHAGGEPIATIAPKSAAGVVALQVPPGGLAAGDSIVVELGGSAGVTAPTDSLSNKVFLLYKPGPERNLGVPATNADAPRTIVGACLIHVTGGRLSRLRAYAPSQLREGEELRILVRPEDERGNVAYEEPGELVVRLNGQELDAQRNPVQGWTCCALDGIRLAKPGVYRLEVEDLSRGLTAVTNPLRLGESLREGGRAAEPTGTQGNLYWGMIHGHTELSDGAGTVDHYFRYMRDTCHLDFGALGDHDHTFETTEEMWRLAQQATARYHEPGHFVTFLGYEWAKWRQNGDGDRNVYYLQDWRPMYRSDNDNYPNPPALFQAIKDETAMVIPHHPAERGNHCDWKDHDPDKERLVEIYSVWGNSERSVHDGNPYPVRPFPQREGAPLDAGEVPAGFVQRALELGWRVGFTAGGDNHSGHPGDERGGLSPWQYKAGLLGVYAAEKTRQAIWEGLWNRRCYATTGARIVVAFTVAGAPMGSELFLADRPELAQSRTIAAAVNGTAPIAKIEVVRNNRDVYVHEGGGPDLSFEWRDMEPFAEIALPPGPHAQTPFCFYYLRVTQEDGEMAWASPVWISE